MKDSSRLKANFKQNQRSKKNRYILLILEKEHTDLYHSLESRYKNLQ